MAETEGPSVADLFRRAQAIRTENAQASYKEIVAQLVREYSASPFPPTYNFSRWSKPRTTSASTALKALATTGTIVRKASKAQRPKASTNGCRKSW